MRSFTTDSSASPPDGQPPVSNEPAILPSSPKPNRWRLVAIVAAVVVVGVVAARFLVGGLTPHLYAGTVLQQSQAAPPLDGLSFASGEPVDLAAFEGEVALVFFGYTNCPDVCPLTLSTVRRAMDQLDAQQRDRVQMMMVSVDPDRDEPQSLQQYVGFFDPGFRGVGGPKEAIDRAATLYGVYYELDRVDEDDQAYLVDHTASLMGIGPDGALRVIWSSEVTADALAADLEELLS